MTRARIETDTRSAAAGFAHRNPPRARLAESPRRGRDRFVGRVVRIGMGCRWHPGRRRQCRGVRPRGPGAPAVRGEGVGTVRRQHDRCRRRHRGRRPQPLPPCQSGRDPRDETGRTIPPGRARGRLRPPSPPQPQPDRGERRQEQRRRQPAGCRPSPVTGGEVEGDGQDDSHRNHVSETIQSPAGRASFRTAPRGSRQRPDGGRPSAVAGPRDRRRPLARQARASVSGLNNPFILRGGMTVHKRRACARGKRERREAGRCRRGRVLTMSPERTAALS